MVKCEELMNKLKFACLVFFFAESAFAFDKFALVVSSGTQANPEKLIEKLVAANYQIALFSDRAASIAGIPSTDPYPWLIVSQLKRWVGSEDVKTPTLKDGDQLVVYFETHGVWVYGDVLGHLIGTKAGNQEYEMDTGKVRQIVDQGAVKVKLVIVDSSCHGGASLNLADANTCVIAPARKDESGWATYTANFSDAMESGKTFEEIFLQSRTNYGYPGSPEISSAIGKRVDQIMEPISDIYALSDWTNFAEFSKKLAVMTPENDMPAQALVDLKFKFDGYFHFLEETKSVYGPLVNASENQTKIGGYDYYWSALKNTNFAPMLEILRTQDPNVETDAYKNILAMSQAKEELMKTNPVFVGYFNDEIKKGNFWRFQNLLPTVKKEREIFDSVYRGLKSGELSSELEQSPCARYQL